MTVRAMPARSALLTHVLDDSRPGSHRFYWEDGNFVEVPAFSGAKTIKFSEPVSEIETYYVPHSETHTLPRLLGKGVRRVDVRGTWRTEIMQALRLFADLKLTGDQSVEFDGKQISSKAFLRQHILQAAADFGGDGEWAFLLNVDVIG